MTSPIAPRFESPLFEYRFRSLPQRSANPEAALNNLYDALPHLDQNRDGWIKGDEFADFGQAVAAYYKAFSTGPQTDYKGFAAFFDKFIAPK